MVVGGDHCNVGLLRFLGFGGLLLNGAPYRALPQLTYCTLYRLQAKSEAIQKLQQLMLCSPDGSLDQHGY